MILVRIRIRGSIPLTYGSGSCSFRQWRSRYQQVFLLTVLLFEGTFTSVFKDKKSSHKTEDRMINVRIRTNNDGSGSATLYNVWIRFRAKTYGSGYTALIFTALIETYLKPNHYSRCGLIALLILRWKHFHLSPNFIVSMFTTILSSSPDLFFTSLRQR